MKISVITCTYNPDYRIISRTLAAVAALKRPDGMEVEYLLVDNNSSPAISQRSEFSEFLMQHSTWVRLIRELKPGLAHARIAGMQASTGEIIIFFDDDNEPEADYLIQLDALRRRYPEAGIWSPGNIWVDFIGRPDRWTQAHALEKLQEIHLDEVKLSYNPHGFEYIPYGTGMIVEREILEEYARLFLSGAYTASDRSGNSLTSVGDVQIVYTAPKFNKAVGRAPVLKLRHMISEGKSNFKYIRRLYYGCSLEEYPVKVQSFPDEQHEQPAPFRDTVRFFTYNSYYFLKMAVAQRNFKKWQCQTAAMIATQEGKYIYHKAPLPWYMRVLKTGLAL